MVLDVDIALLGAADLFSVLDAEQRRLIAFGARRVQLLPGDQLYAEGEQARGAYVLDSGVLESVVRHGTVASDIGLSLRGDVLGETALLAPTVWPTTMVAREASSLILIERDVFLRLLEEYPELARDMKDRFSVRLGQFIDQINVVKPGLDQDV